MIIHEVIVKEKLNKIAQSLGIIYKVLASLMSAALSYLVLMKMKLKTPNCGRRLILACERVESRRDSLDRNLSDVRLPHTPLHKR
jgi:hypothetical protein